ncbi:MAG: glycosyltransferase family 2 protein [Ignavibacteria bacterium]|nr:glycosyltransferase family 2 protein [Ignavibacteria bacterium]
MIKISSLIIAKNEEANIKRCIESQLNCIDEIFILLDDSTSDSSEEIIKTYPQVRYEKIKWLGYSETKSYGLTKLSHNWVLWLDADEELTPELQKDILDFKNSTPEFSAYSMPRRAFFLGKWIKHCGWYPGRVVRLFDKEKSVFSTNDVHERLNVNGAVGELKTDINHYTDPSIEHYYDKFNRYTSLAAKDAFKKKSKVSLADLLLRPIFIFVKMYIIRKGFLDGRHGFILSVFSANYVFTKYAKIWEASNKK